MIPDEETEPIVLLAMQVYFPLSATSNLSIAKMEETPGVTLKHKKSHAWMEQKFHSKYSNLENIRCCLTEASVCMSIFHNFNKSKKRKRHVFKEKSHMCLCCNLMNLRM